MKVTTYTYDQLVQKAVNCLKEAQVSFGKRDDEHTKFCFAAARAWLNRAEYSIRNNGLLKSSDNEIADGAMFQELLGDYTK